MELRPSHPPLQALPLPVVAVPVAPCAALERAGAKGAGATWRRLALRFGGENPVLFGSVTIGDPKKDPVNRYRIVEPSIPFNL